MKVYFFGRVDEGGHHLHSPNLNGRREHALLEWMHRNLGPIDQGFAPNLDKSQGSAHVERVKGWTILAWHDYTGDSRPGSNSAVIAEGTQGFEDMLALFKHHFPTIAKRQTAPLRITTQAANFQVR